MNREFLRVVSAADRDREQLFVAVSERMGTPVVNIEKDFWVCWLLDLFFNGLRADSPRRLFKGGTSLSKCYGLIDRFSEDVDVAIFRDDLGHAATVAALEALSGQKRKAALEAILAACQAYFRDDLLPELTAVSTKEMTTAGVAAGRYKLEFDPGDPDRQSLLFHYPAATAGTGYVQAVVKLEGGARSALEPTITTAVRPYVAEDVAGSDLTVGNVVVIRPERTFWDKIVLLHGLRRWFDARGQLPQGGQRLSRHYYDVHKLLMSSDAMAWVADRDLGRSCAQHARLFFYRPDYRLDEAVAGQYSLTPTPEMEAQLSTDYERMRVMLFGAAPAFGEVLASIKELEARLLS